MLHDTVKVFVMCYALFYANTNTVYFLCVVSDDHSMHPGMPRILKPSLSGGETPTNIRS